MAGALEGIKEWLEDTANYFTELQRDEAGDMAEPRQVRPPPSSSS